MLWRLLNSSARAPFCDRMDASSRTINDMMESVHDSLSELSEVEKLENMFKIPPIDAVLKDKLLRSLALKWFRHFKREIHNQSIQGCLYSSPAVPFRLMNLPNIYQDLLQRFVDDMTSLTS